MSQTKLRTEQLETMEARSFIARQTAGNATSIASQGTGYPVICDTNDYDPHGLHSTTTGKFTPDLPGTYKITANGVLKGMNVDKAVFLGIGKNGDGSKKRWIALASSSDLGYGGASGSGLVYMNGSTDYIEFLIWNGDSTARYTYDTYSNAVFWGAERISEDDICGFS